MLLLGIDIGTSSVKVSVVNAVIQQLIASEQFPVRIHLQISKSPNFQII